MTARGRFESRRRARRRALQALYQWQLTGQEADEILAQFRAAQDMTGVDDAYFETLLRGVVSEHESLDAELQPFLDRPLKHVDLMERVVLSIGAFELLNCPELPVPVVLDECIDLAQRFGSEQGHSFVNAVLDRAARHWRAADPGAS